MKKKRQQNHYKIIIYDIHKNHKIIIYLQTLHQTNVIQTHMGHTLMQLEINSMNT